MTAGLTVGGWVWYASSGRFNREFEPGMLKRQWHLADRRMGLGSRFEYLGVLARSEDWMATILRGRDPHREPCHALRFDDESCWFLVAHAVTLAAIARLQKAARLNPKPRPILGRHPPRETVSGAGCHPWYNRGMKQPSNRPRPHPGQLAFIIGMTFLIGPVAYSVIDPHAGQIAIAFACWIAISAFAIYRYRDAARKGEEDFPYRPWHDTLP
jgi:hypothetical protein